MLGRLSRAALGVVDPRPALQGLGQVLGADHLGTIEVSDRARVTCPTPIVGMWRRGRQGIRCRYASVAIATKSTPMMTSSPTPATNGTLGISRS